MALVVQNDDGFAAGANSYASYAEFVTYFTDRATDTNAAALTDYIQSQVEGALIAATDYVNKRFRYVGRRKSRDQNTEWPRLNAFDNDGYLVTGIPQAVKFATIEYAYRALQLGSVAPDPTNDPTGQAVTSITETVGPISSSRTFVAGLPQYQQPIYPVADMMLTGRGLTTSGQGFSTFSMGRS